MGKTHERKNLVVRKRRRMILPLFQNMHEVVEDGKEFVFTGWEMWLRAVCDDYLRTPSFPAATQREYYGYTDHNGVYHPPLAVPYVINGKTVLGNGGAPITMTIHEIPDYRPGAVWMTRKLFYRTFTELTGTEPDHADYVEKRMASAKGYDLGGEYYHPAQSRFSLMTRKGRLFTPHTIDPVRHHIQPDPLEQFNGYRRDKDGRAPKVTGLYMIEPHILKQINRDHVYDVFMERRAAFDIAATQPKPNMRMWGWRDLLKTLCTYPVFDRETVRRLTADEDMWGEEYASDATVDSHLSRWVKSVDIVRERHGLYRPARSRADHTDHNPADHFLVDWFFEFLRRQALRQRQNPKAMFTFAQMADDLNHFHPDWIAFHAVKPAEQVMRKRLNAATEGMAGVSGESAWIGRRGLDRWLTDDALDLFCPAEVRSI